MMQAMRCEAPGRPLERRTLPVPVPGPGELLIEVRACGVCRTDLHLVDGELANARYPVIPGHEIVGTVVAHGPGASPRAPPARAPLPERTAARHRVRRAKARRCLPPTWRPADVRRPARPGRPGG
jgi:threonine dehydrogenase-like Zn-dependent dehydrogenase